MKRREVLSLLGSAALTPFATSPLRADPSNNCGGPAARDDGWAVASSADDKLIDRAALCKMAERLATSTNIHSVLVVRGGKLLFERYLAGEEQVPGLIHGHRMKYVTFDADTLHHQKSVSKSVASLVLGIAIDRGLIRSLDQPIFNFFPELSDLRSPDKDRIQLLHALTMSMGLKWVEATPATGDDDNDEARMNMASDPCRYVLGLPVTAPAGRDFFYNTGALMLISAIVRKATGRTLDDFAREALFAPLGITSFEWSRTRGDTDAGGGLHLRPRDMAKIGQLVLAGGRWNDRQIVSKAWIDASTAFRHKAADSQSYGYLWWLGRTQVNGRTVDWVGAQGRGGQSIRIVPELDLVVVVTAGYYEDYSRDAFRTQFSVFRDVLQALPPAG